MAGSSVKRSGKVEVGDKVQIRPGGIDVTNGLIARENSLYGQGGPLWATVVAIHENWPTGGLHGLPNTVTKVRCIGVNGSTIVWQVRPGDIADNIIKANPSKEPAEEPKQSPKKDGIAWRNEVDTGKRYRGGDVSVSSDVYAPRYGSDAWWTGSSSHISNDIDTLPSTASIDTVKHPLNPFSDNNNGSPTYEKVKGSTKGLPHSVSASDTMIARFPTAWQDPKKKTVMLNRDPDLIQNNYGFPFLSTMDSRPLSQVSVASTYDYKFILDDPKFSRSSKSSLNLEDKLMKVRAAIGLPVHGNNQIAKSMKMYMYNRFKVPDQNMAFTKSFTHVFFTRPDLNILQGSGSSVTVSDQCCNHSESAMLWRTNPELFKMLVDGVRCGDINNFNLLLSNQILNFDFEDDGLATTKVGKAWDEHDITYGDIFNGRHGGEFRCNFADTSELSIIKMIRLWILYIDNVKRGVWKPSYSLNGVSDAAENASHVFSRTLDYAASAYVFKCGPDGEDVIYWAKYYGVFPINTGTSSLSWDSSTGSPDSPPKPNITFAYSAKEVLSPISLLEFNHNARVIKSMEWLPSFNVNIAGSARPFVGTPYIEMDIANDISMEMDDVARTSKKSSIRLKFQQDNRSVNGGSPRRDTILYRSSLSNI